MWPFEKTEVLDSSSNEVGNLNYFRIFKMNSSWFRYWWNFLRYSLYSEKVFRLYFPFLSIKELLSVFTNWMQPWISPTTFINCQIFRHRNPNVIILKRSWAIAWGHGGIQILRLPNISRCRYESFPIYRMRLDFQV